TGRAAISPADHRLSDRRLFLPGGHTASIQKSDQTSSLHVGGTLYSRKGQNRRHDVEILDLLIDHCALAHLRIVRPMKDQRNLIQFTVDTVAVKEPPVLPKF